MCTAEYNKVYCHIYKGVQPGKALPSQCVTLSCYSKLYLLLYK